MVKKEIYSALALMFLNILLINNALATNSVLSSGTWHKMSVQTTGMYCITYSKMAEMVPDVNSVNPNNIRLYHNGGGLLPVINKDSRPNDLVEIPTLIIGGDDGRFDDGDLVVFYARGPVTWSYNENNGFYEHARNAYSDYAYIFMTIGDTPGKRIETASKPTGSATVTDEFLDAMVYEKDEFNLNNMGRTWYCDKFDITLERNYKFDFPNVVTTRKAKIRSEIATRNPASISFKYKVGSDVVATISLSAMGSTQYTYAQTASTNVRPFNAKSDDLGVTLTFNRTGSASVGWLNYIEMNAWRKLILASDVMTFRNPECNDATQLYEYRISNANSSTQVWDVTNPVEPKRMDVTLNSSTLSFKAFGKEGSEYIAFNGNSFGNVTVSEVNVPNQNLHAMKDVDYLIIAHPKFVSHAQRLKEIHSRLDDLIIEIVEPQPIYNEFSCGALDIIAIRDFIKMLNDNSSDEHKLKYVLLFGDASYAYKNPEVCFIPSYESVQSCSITACRVTDDVFVCLDPNEGDMTEVGIIDIPIARMPVSTEQQASEVLDKLEAFIAKNEYTMNRWRNVVTLVCDDEENAGHCLRNSETVAKLISENGGEVVIDKIYLDAYNQVATASGQRCPEVNEAITNRIENGTLLVNYVGHGGEVGWAEERILTNEDINTWQNIPMLPIFLTATCEFSRFDDHTRTSAGELLFLNPKGGAINMVTTARTTQGSESMKLVNRFYNTIFKMYGGEYQCIGDIFMYAKQNNSPNSKVYVLFGDPALRIAYPKNNVVLTKLNGKIVNEEPLDTLKALSYNEIEGEIRDNFGDLMSDFNGIVQVTVYDKESTFYTKGDHGYDPTAFQLRNSTIYNGKADVVGGRFSLGFTVPKDIKYNYGDGLISFYATDYETDANGSFSGIVVGGNDDTVIPDVDGPEVRVFIDDTLFVSGDITNENPLLVAKVRDINGINTSGAGIGHDITAVLSGATNKSYNLNNFYETPLGLDDFGNITYRFYNLNEGEHNLKLRVWDIYNNSTTVSLDFVVVKSSGLVVQKLMNTPNPMRNETRITFEHNQKEEIDVTVRIYNINGQLVRTIRESRYGASMRIEPVVWDGTNDGGATLPSGIYIYNVTVSNSKNETSSSHSKLVITR